MVAVNFSFGKRSGVAGMCGVVFADSMMSPFLVGRNLLLEKVEIWSLLRFQLAVFDETFVEEPAEERGRPVMCGEGWGENDREDQ